VPFDNDAVAEFGIVAHDAPVVPLTICTDALPPDARSVGPNTKWPLALIEKPFAAPEIDQPRPGVVGNASSTVTPVAVPGPALDTVTVKPIWVPADTGDASAVFAIDTLGHCTTTLA
jgi:hypothetical protein